MPTKNYKQAAAFLKEHGFTFDRTNSKQFDFYTHPDCGEVSVGQSIADHAVKALVRSVQKRLGEATAKDQSKRDPARVRQRQADERVHAAAEVERHDRIIASLISQREKRMNGLGAILTDRELLAIEARIEELERERRRWAALMTEIPTTNAHSGRRTAQHRS